MDGKAAHTHNATHTMRHTHTMRDTHTHTHTVTVHEVNLHRTSRGQIKGQRSNLVNRIPTTPFTGAEFYKRITHYIYIYTHTHIYIYRTVSEN